MKFLRPFLPRHFGLRGRIVLLVVIASLPTFALFVFHTRHERQWLLNQAEDRALQIARAWNEHNGEYLDEANVLLRLTDGIAPRGGDCVQKLGFLGWQTHWTAEVAIVGRDGEVLCSSQSDSIITGHLDKLYLADLFDTRSLEISEFQRDDHGRSIAFAGLRLPLGADGIQKAAVTVIDLAEIQRRTGAAAEGLPYTVMVLGRDGTILAQHPESQAGLGARLPGNHPLVPSVNLQIEGATAGVGPDGVEQIFAFTQVPQTGAKVVVALPRDAVLGAEDQAVKGILIAMVFVALLAALGAWLMAELSVLRWVSELTQAAIAFGRRDLDHRAKVPKRAHEFSTLATAFNGMATMLAERHRELETARDVAESATRAVQSANEELERRVVERTSALTAAQSELMKQERFSAVGQLASTLAHELRNPLSAARNTVFVIQSVATASGVDVGRPIHRLERSIMRCDRIIANLSDYVYDGDLKRRVANGQRWLDDYLEGQTLPDGIALVRQFEAPDARVSIDPSRLQLVIANILDNAVQAILDANGIRPARITISTVVTDRLLVTVEDTGTGIAPEVMPHIFETLFSTRGFGMGLGLPTARNIVEQHGGSITVDSAIGKGTVVTVSLPLARETSSDAKTMLRVA